MTIEIQNLDRAIHQEAERKLQLLGDCAVAETYQHDQFSERAFQVTVPLPIFKSWWLAYRKSGVEGLKPTDWQEMDDADAELVATRFSLIAAIVRDGVIKRSEIAELALARGCSYRTMERWVARYQAGGLMGLAPHHNPMKTKRVESPPRDLGTLDEATLQSVYERRDQLGDLAEKTHVSNAEIEARANEVNVSPRTLRSYWSNYQRFGLAGLAPRQRSDNGTRHMISERMTEVIKGIRLTKKDAPLRMVFELACQKARDLGETEPSLWQVRSICEQIPKGVRHLADERESQYVGAARITYPLKFHAVTYLVDNTLVDVLVRDLRHKNLRAPSGEVRPWQTQVFEATSRTPVATVFGYDRPNSYTVATALRNAFIEYGSPDAIWIDRGKEFTSNHVEQLTRSLGIGLKILPPRSPQVKGRVERFFGTLNTRLWSTLPGYVNSSVKDRNPSVKAELTMDQLVQQYNMFIEMYLHEVHSQLNMTPAAYWAENCYTEPVDHRVLDVLLHEPLSRKVTKQGVNFNGSHYWHVDLATIVGEHVLIRADTRYGRPDEIEVFYDGSWLCTAFTSTSKRGQQVTRRDVGGAQRAQRNAIRERIDDAAKLIEDVDNEILILNTPPNPATISPPKKEKVAEPNSPNKRPQRSGFLQRMANANTKLDELECENETAP